MDQSAEKQNRKLVIAALFVVSGLPVWYWNHTLFQLINGAHAPLADTVIGTVAGFGDGLLITLILSCLMLFRLRIGAAGLTAYLLSGVIAQLLKRLFDMPRPPAVMENVHVLGAALQSHTFPSGHATSCGVMILLAFMLWKREQWQAWAFAGLFALAAYGRIYGGVHFPFDVWIGLAIGLATMSAVRHAMMRRPVWGWEQSEWAWRVPVVMVIIEAAVLGLGYRMQPSTAQPLTLVVPVAALLVLMRFWKGKSANG